MLNKEQMLYIPDCYVMEGWLGSIFTFEKYSTKGFFQGKWGDMKSRPTTHSEFMNYGINLDNGVSINTGHIRYVRNSSNSIFFFFFSPFVYSRVVAHYHWINSETVHCINVPWTMGQPVYLSQKKLWFDVTAEWQSLSQQEEDKDKLFQDFLGWKVIVFFIFLWIWFLKKVQL